MAGDAVQPHRGERIDDAVGADLVRPVEADRDRHRARGRDEHRDPVARRDGLERGRQRRDDRCDGHRGNPVERMLVEREQVAEQDLELVGRLRATRARPAGRRDRAVLHEAERDVRVADVDREQHAGIIRRPMRAECRAGAGLSASVRADASPSARVPVARDLPPWRRRALLDAP